MGREQLRRVGVVSVDPRRPPRGVDCGGVCRCVVHGGGPLGNVLTSNGSSWSAPTLLDLLGNLNAVSCSSVTCVTVGRRRKRLLLRRCRRHRHPADDESHLRQRPHNSPRPRHNRRRRRTNRFLPRRVRARSLPTGERVDVGADHPATTNSGSTTVRVPDPTVPDIGPTSSAGDDTGSGLLAVTKCTDVGGGHP